VNFLEVSDLDARDCRGIERKPFERVREFQPVVRDMRSRNAGSRAISQLFGFKFVCIPGRAFLTSFSGELA
jgi:hypothetical protein